MSNRKAGHRGFCGRRQAIAASVGFKTLWVIWLGGTTQDVAVLKMGMSPLEWPWSLPECPREGREEGGNLEGVGGGKKVTKRKLGGGRRG